MKIKSVKICAASGCNKEFKLYKSTDKFCSSSCAYKSNKKQSKKPTKPILKFSEKRKIETSRYSRLRKIFLTKSKNTFCPVCKAVYKGKIDSKELNQSEIIFQNNGLIPATEIHHKAGRRGKFLNHVPLWLAVSRIGHVWIHANPEKAYKLNFLIKNTTVKI